MVEAIDDMTPASRRRGRPSAADTGARQAELLRVAREQFAERGYRQTTVAGIAEAAGLTKRTIYLWHGDKEGLFRACIALGATRFPVLPGDGTSKAAVTLNTYLTALIVELSAEDSYAMGRIFPREGVDFPDLAVSVENSYTQHIIEPLAAYLRHYGLEEAGSVKYSELLVSMALAPTHNNLLLGRAMPSATEARTHAAFVTDFFLDAHHTAHRRAGAQDTK